MKTALHYIWKIVSKLIYLAFILYVFSMVEGRQNVILVSLVVAVFITQESYQIVGSWMLKQLHAENQRQLASIRRLLGDQSLPLGEPDLNPEKEAEAKAGLDMSISIIANLIGLLICFGYLVFGSGS